MLDVFYQCNEIVKSRCIGGNFQAWRRVEFNGVALAETRPPLESIFYSIGMVSV
jgi:hypothetical protein